MEELEQNLENLDELRRQAKDYANTLVLPNNERLSIEDPQVMEDRKAELLQKRDAQEAKLNAELTRDEALSNEKIYVSNNERYSIEKENTHEDRVNELQQLRDAQEARWKMESEKSLIGKLSKKIKEKINGNDERKKELLQCDFLEEVAHAAQKADEKLSKTVDLSQDKLLDNIPNEALEEIKDDELLFTMEIENGRARILSPNNQGSVFSSILITLTTLTVGIVAAAIMLIK